MVKLWTINFSCKQEMVDQEMFEGDDLRQKDPLMVLTEIFFIYDLFAVSC